MGRSSQSGLMYDSLFIRDVSLYVFGGIGKKVCFSVELSILQVLVEAHDSTQFCI